MPAKSPFQPTCQHHRELQWRWLRRHHWPCLTNDALRIGATKRPYQGQIRSESLYSTLINAPISAMRRVVLAPKPTSGQTSPLSTDSVSTTPILGDKLWLSITCRILSLTGSIFLVIISVNSYTSTLSVTSSVEISHELIFGLSMSPPIPSALTEVGSIPSRCVTVSGLK